MGPRSWCGGSEQILTTSSACAFEILVHRVSARRSRLGMTDTWSTTFPARGASASPVSLTLETSNETVLRELVDIVFGHVLLFSGQSNIDIPQTYGHQVYTPSLPGCRPQNDTNRSCSITNTSAQQDTELRADDFGRARGLLRIMIVPGPQSSQDATPLAELLETPDCALCPPPGTPYTACSCSAMKWARANASNVRGFSATAWFTGASIMRLLGSSASSRIPVGLVRSSMGGTQIQLWSSPTALRACGNTTAPGFWRNYSSLWASMISPFKGLSFAGVVWYQGEANVGPDRSEPEDWGTGPTGPANYHCQLPSMLRDWRQQLQQADLPVFVVELSGYCNEYDTHTFLSHCDQHRSHLKASNKHLPALRLAQSITWLEHVRVIPNHDLGS